MVPGPILLRENGAWHHFFCGTISFGVGRTTEERACPLFLLSPFSPILQVLQVWPQAY
jgi:hypothetical protein